MTSSWFYKAIINKLCLRILSCILNPSPYHKTRALGTKGCMFALFLSDTFELCVITMRFPNTNVRLSSASARTFTKTECLND